MRHAYIEPCSQSVPKSLRIKEGRTIVIQVLLADEHPTVRAGVRAELEGKTDIQVVAEADTGESVIRFVGDLQPDVVVMEVQLSGDCGIAACRYIVDKYPKIAVVMLSAFDWDSYLARSWAAGASGFVSKRLHLTELVTIIRHTRLTERWFTPMQLNRILVWREQVEDRLNMLTLREHEVLRLMVEGFTNPEIAKHLSISVKTTECHVRSILSKFDLHDRREVITWIKHTRALHIDMPHLKNQGEPLKTVRIS
jgi:DNA-binding NarL/FixJ family response regulator